MNEKKENKIIIGLIILVVALSAGWIGLRLYNTKIHNQLKDAQSELITAQKKYKKALAQAEKKYIANSATSKDNQVSSIGQHKNNYDIKEGRLQTPTRLFYLFWNRPAMKATSCRRKSTRSFSATAARSGIVNWSKLTGGCDQRSRVNVAAL